jgi:hypothetical protein
MRARGFARFYLIITLLHARLVMRIGMGNTKGKQCQRWRGYEWIVILTASQGLGMKHYECSA